MSFKAQDSSRILQETQLNEKFVWHKKIEKLRKQGLTKQQIAERDRQQERDDIEVYYYFF